MSEQIIIGVRGPKGEKIEVLEFDQKWLNPQMVEGGVNNGSDKMFTALERAWTRYKKIKT